MKGIYKMDDCKELDVSNMSSELLGMLFDWGLAEHELCFDIYIQHFVKTTYQILDKKYMGIDEFMTYITQRGPSLQQRLANEIYKKLQTRNKWGKQKSGFIKLESLLFQYEISQNLWQKKSEEAKRLNDIKYKETRKVREFILELYKTRPYKMVFKKFFEKYQNSIKEYIEKTCPKLDDKIKNDNNFDLYGYVERVIRTRNQRDNKNIIRVRWD